MTLEAKIARQIYQELRNTARDSKSVRLPVRMAELQQFWPEASHDQILRAHLIAYELLILEVAEGIPGASGAGSHIPPFPGKEGSGGDGDGT